MNTRVFVLLKGAWGIFIAASFTVLLTSNLKSNRQVAKQTASSFFKEIVTTRAWNANHGGVYVFVDDQTQPNPDLDVPYRDIYTTDSMMLTLINPAYMTRQISELAEKNNDVLYHITSLKPIRALNKADIWETRALESFEKGEKEAFELTDFRNGKYFRYMAPLMVDQSCLSCHAKQGYQVGQVRGGISVSINADQSISKNQSETALLIVAHLLLFLIGLIGIGYAQNVITRQFTLTQLKTKQVSEHKNRLSIINKELVEINHQREKFLDIIAHDLRNPVGAIMGLSEILVEEIESAAIEHKKLLINQLHKSAVNTYELMENLLIWSRNQQGKMQKQLEPVVLKELVENSIDLVHQMARAKSITLLKSCEAPKSIEVLADKNMLSTILRNLLTNAVKFTPENGVIEIKAVINIDQMAEISISDNGIGMPKEKIDTLFNIEKSTSSPGTNNEMGTGLGLILVKEFVEKNSGKLYINSELGAGTTVTFTIPLNS